MEPESIVTLVAAVLALIGTLYSARRVKKISEKPDIVDQAGQVSGLAVSQMNQMADRAEELQEKLEKAEDKLESFEMEMVEFEFQIRSMTKRIQALEEEIIRLGGDPSLVLPALPKRPKLSGVIRKRLLDDSDSSS